MCLDSFDNLSSSGSTNRSPISTRRSVKHSQRPWSRPSPGVPTRHSRNQDGKCYQHDPNETGCGKAPSAYRLGGDREPLEIRGQISTSNAISSSSVARCTYVTGTLW